MAAPFNYLTKAGAPVDGVRQVETATIVGDITIPGDAEVVVTAAGMTGSPITVSVPVSARVQVETATVVGTITGDGNAEVVVTANGMTGSPKTVNVAVDNGAAQVETATVVGTITTDGNAAVTVTANGMTGSPKIVQVAVQSGVAQVETATVVGTIEPAGAGDVEVIVTAAGMTGSPKTVAVAVANDDTASDVAGKIRAALTADADVGHVTTGFFTVSGSGADVVLTAKTKATNDATLNVSIDNDTSAGLTAAPTSANTTAGVAPDNADAVAGKIRTALGLDAAITALFDVSGATDKVILTRKAPFAANDATLNIATDNGTCAGLTAAPSSANTTAGVAPDDAAAVAGKIRTALAADADIGDAGTGFFTVSGSGAQVILTAKAAAANDATMNLSIDNGTCEGLTAVNSYNTSVGGAGDTAAQVAAKIRAALEAHAVIGAFFTVGGSGADVVLTARRSAAEDATLNIAYDNDTCAGLTPDATSTTTTAGVLGNYRGCEAGQILADTTNTVLYKNIGDANCPVWTLA
jgi:hypothetical protein